MAARLFEVPLSRITDNPFQPRQHYDPAALEELTSSILKEGLLQPPKARLVDGRGLITAEITNMLRLVHTQAAFLDLLEANPSWMVQLQSGHRRKRAFQLANSGSFLEDADRHRSEALFPFFLEQADDKDMAVRAYVENDPRLREDLSSVDEALFMQRLMEEFDWTQAVVAEQLGLQRPTVSNKLRLLNLPDDVIAHVRSGTLSERQALALLPAFDLTGEESSVLYAVGDPGNDGYAMRSEMVKDALSGVSSDVLRNGVGILKAKIDRKVAISRDVPPLLYVDSFEGLIEFSHAGITHDPDRQVNAFLELSGGLLAPGRTVRFLVTGSLSNASGSHIRGFEILTPEEFHERPSLHVHHGGPVTSVDGTSYVLGHYLSLSTEAPAEGSISLVSKIQVETNQTAEIGEEQEGEADQHRSEVSYVEQISEEQAEKLIEGNHDRDYFLKQLQDLGNRNLKADPPVKNGQRVLDAPILQIQMAAVRYSKIAQEAEGWAQEAEKAGFPELAERFRRVGSAATSSYKMFQSRYDQLAGKQHPLPASGGDGTTQLAEPDSGVIARALPKPVMPEVYDLIGGMTKADLTQTQERFTCQLWEKFARNWQAGSLKADMLQYVTELLRFHANLRVVYALDDDQLLQMLAWMREKVSGDIGYAWSKSVGKSEASQVLRGLRDIEHHDHLTGQALRAFQLDYARRMGAFYYHAFYKAMKLDRSRSKEGVVTA